MPVYIPTGPELRVNSTVAGDQYGSTITSFGDGSYVIAWAGSAASGSAGYDIYSQRYAADGTAIGGEVRVNTTETGAATASGFQHAPVVTTLAGGGYVVSWLGPGTESPDMYAQRYTAAGVEAGGEFQVNTSVGFHNLPTITALADGGFVVVWVGPGAIGAGGTEIRAQRYGADGAAAGGEFRVNTVETGDQSAPTVTAFANGAFVVCWTTPGGNGPDIHAQMFGANGAPAGAEFRVNSNIAGDQLRPSATGLADGGYIVTWVGTETPGGGDYDVLAQRFRADGSANGGEFRVNTAFRADANGAVDVTTLGDGSFLVTWSGIGIGAADIYGQRYAASGAALGGEFRLNTTTAGYQYGPSIAKSGADGFVATWSDKTPIGADFATEVFAQRFALVPGIAVAANTPSLAEGNAGATTFTFTVTLDTAMASTQTVEWQALGFGANPAAATDFVGGTAPSGTLTFLAGEREKIVTVQVAGDAGAEWSETFAIQLSKPSAGVGLANGTAIATIVDDETVFERGTDGNDTFVGRPGVFSREGMLGHDELIRSDIGFRGAAVTAQADGGVLITRGFDVELMRGVEEVRFMDGRLTFAPYDPAAKVTRLYEAALDRLPDQGGLNFWTKAVQNGEPLSSLASGFLASPEFQARFGGATTSNGAFVDQLYQNVLGRAGEAEGRAFWVNGLNGGAVDRADVLASFSESFENQQGTAALVRNGIWDRSESAAEVARMYDTVFNRRPDVEGLTFWKNALDGGTASREMMADAFTGSAEFAAQYGALGNRDFANALYVNTLDRPADQAGLDFWTNALNAGAARSEVVLAFSESAEHVNLTSAAIGGEAPSQYGILFA